MICTHSVCILSGSLFLSYVDVNMVFDRRWTYSFFGFVCGLLCVISLSVPNGFPCNDTVYSTKTSIWGTGQVGSVKNFKVPKKRRPKVSEQFPVAAATKDAPVVERKQQSAARNLPKEDNMVANASSRSSKAKSILHDTTDRVPLMPLETPNDGDDTQPRPMTDISVTADAPSSDLADGSFDEGESHASFLEALNAWRGGSDVRMTDVNAGANAPSATPIEVQTEPPTRYASASSSTQAYLSTATASKTRPTSARKSYFFTRVAQTQAAQKAANADAMGRIGNER